MSNSLRYLITCALIGMIWQAAAIALGDTILPAPAAVGRIFLHLLSTREFWEHARVSFARASSGIILSFALFFPLGLWLGASPKADRWFSPFLFLTYPIPKILFLPVLLVMLGLGESPKIILIILTCGYQILVVTRDSLRNLPPSYLLSFKAIEKRPGQILSLTRHVLAPAALPSAVSALRLATGTAVAVLFMTESFATERGLGFMIMDAWGGLDLPRMFSGIMAMSLMGLLLYAVIDMIENRCCRWTSLQ